ncbi:MAG: hypothetical protein AAB116_06960 [Candidatus Poribacteria bacterium]
MIFHGTLRHQLKTNTTKKGLEDLIQVGMIDRTIYCGEYKEGTATLSHNFRIWKKQNEH